MSYLSIENLYRPAAQLILMFREVFALEKVHGTSSNIRWSDGRVTLSSGGEKASRFEALFDLEELKQRFVALGHPTVVVYGEAYGGSQQKQAWRYGDKLRFVAFEVMIGDTWLSVLDAEAVCEKLGIRFVAYEKVSTELSALDAERDRPSTEAVRNGVVGDQPREGVVLRPLREFQSNGNRIIAKHKRAEERETTKLRAVVDPMKLEVLTQAEAIATEWVTPTRLEHVLDKMPHGIGMEATRDVIVAMTEDVLREGSGEFVDSREARSEIGKLTAKLFREKLKQNLQTSMADREERM